MNEVTKVHLGRQAFTISVAAQKELRGYLDAIAKQVDDADVTEEVELRMAELLSERGVSGDKVILPADVKYLKDQLGDPKDFKEDDQPTKSVSRVSGDKRLFRDPENAWVAGVAAGLAAFFGVDVLLIRLLFVIGTFAWGGSIIVYILLWLLVPEAKSGSDRLQMVGKPVTVEGLKEVVERADVKGAAHRANNKVAPFINSFFRVVLKVTGIGFMLGSLAVIFALIAVRTYMSLHHGQLFQENLFPVGTTEHILADLGLALTGLLAIFGVVCGLALVKRRWPIRGWITGVLVGLFFIGFAAAIALAADVAPNVRDRYLSRSHTVTRSVQPFQDVTIQGKDVDYQWQYADSYSVSFHYFDNPDISKIKTTVKNDLLTIDTTNYQRERNCNMLCIFPAYDLMITVKGPQPLSTPYPASSVPQIFPGSKHYYR
ncbi:MAG TPA: PspC domain-containing protein [Candidatus Saccharimonadales bacterium]|nr:PspC domain-containing protein [Candidatus Saccharimonadales bacterium]